MSIRYVLVGLLTILGVYIVVDHGAHLVPYLPFAFLLGCLSMHMFMHGRHNGDHMHHEHGQQ